MFTKLYFPNLKSDLYLYSIDRKLKDNKTLGWDHDQYLRLLNLKKLTSQAANSLSQLNNLFDDTSYVKGSLPNLEAGILLAIDAVLKGQQLPPDLRKNVRNSFTLLKSLMEDDSLRQKSFSVFNIFTNTITTAICLTGACLGAFAISTGGIGVIACGVVLALIATTIALIAAYSLYVDGRYLANKQVEEIDSFIDTLFAYNQKTLPIGQEAVSTLVNPDAAVPTMPGLEPVYIPLPGFII